MQAAALVALTPLAYGAKVARMFTGLNSEIVRGDVLRASVCLFSLLQTGECRICRTAADS